MHSFPPHCLKAIRNFLLFQNKYEHRRLSLKILGEFQKYVKFYEPLFENSLQSDDCENNVDIKYLNVACLIHLEFGKTIRFKSSENGLC